MKLNIILIVVLVFSTLFVTSQAYAPCIEGPGINCNNYPPPELTQIKSDKINYETSDIPVITIVGVPYTVAHLEIDDSSSNIMFEHDLNLSSNGTIRYVIDISSYKPGGYSATATSLVSKVTTSFSVGLTPTGGRIVISPDRNSYLPGDNVTILGTGNSNTLIQLSLIDPSGISTKSSQTFSDKTGHFSSSNLVIPMDAISGIWQIDATSGVMHSRVQISINSTVDNHSKIKLGVVPSPLKQFKSGISAIDVKCADEFILVIKAEDNSPACVKPDTVQKLVERGWAKEIVSANNTTATQMELKAYGFVCCGLDGDLLKGYLSTSTSFVSNATVQISINGIVMGYTETYPDGCFQFNQWNESKLAEQTDAFLANEKKSGVYKLFNLTFTARFAGDKNYDPTTAQTASAMSLTAIPLPPPQLETTLRPPQVNLTQGSSSNFQVSIRPMVEQWNIPHLNLYLEGYPCETYFRLSQSSDNNTASTTHPALFDGTLSASTDSPEGKYFVHMIQNGTNRFVANDIGTFPLDVMKMK